jgi:hypothetical protein
LTKYYGLHINCGKEEICYCEQNCGGTHTITAIAVTNSKLKVKARSTNDLVLYQSTSTILSLSGYKARKLGKRKSIHHTKSAENLSWIEEVSPLIIVTTPDNHNIFLWLMVNPFLAAEVRHSLTDQRLILAASLHSIQDVPRILKIARDLTLTVELQSEWENVTQKDTETMNEGQLRDHIREINTGLVALVQLPTTSRLNELQKAK